MSGLSNNYDAWYAQRIVEGASRALQPWHLNAARFLPDLNHCSVLEIGCGTGDFSKWIAENYRESDVIGVDFSETAIRAAQENSPSSAGTSPRFQVEDAQALSFASRSFDFVVSCECLEHVPRPELMAKEIARVLKLGGGFVITTENYFNGMLLGWLNIWLRGRPFDSGSGVQPHENFFLFWRVRKILERAGLRVEEMTSNHFQWLLLPRVNPDRLRTDGFRNPKLNRFFRAFGRHFTFHGKRA